MQLHKFISNKQAIFSLLIFFIVCSLWALSSYTSTFKQQKAPIQTSCDKIPPSLSNALIHYATSNITPQQTPSEIAVTQSILEVKSPCKFLVFGLGLDSVLWASLNHMGRTVFLEENADWIQKVGAAHPELDSHLVEYGTKVNRAGEMLLRVKGDKECGEVVDPRDSKCEIAHKGFPQFVYEIEWDLVMVDAPTGYHEEAPGRMSVIYTVGLMARRRKRGELEVFVHDVDRVIEDEYSKAFLCEEYLVEEVGKLRHFTIPSNRNGRVPFCP